MKEMSKLATPDYRLEDAQNVYPPSEDTFLLLDALEADQKRIAELDPTICLEVGSGSGVVSAFVHTVLSSAQTSDSEASTSEQKKPVPVSICTDLNRQALLCTRRTFGLNRIAQSPQLVHCNLLGPLFVRLRHSVDLLLCNPPYVPTENEPRDDKELCYAGGPASGRALLDRLLPHVAQLLSRDGLFYLVALKENDVAELTSPLMRQKHGIEGQIVLQRQCRNEFLYIIRFSRIDTDQSRDTRRESSREEESVKEAEKADLTAKTTETAAMPASPSAPSKITIHLKPVGGAPQLSKAYTKLATKPDSSVAYIQQVLRKWISLKPDEQLFLFVNESFAPLPEHTVGDLYACFGSPDSGGKLYMQYSVGMPAWG